MVKYLRISSYIRMPFLIYDFATDPIWISLYEENFVFFFNSVVQDQIVSISCFPEPWPERNFESARRLRTSCAGSYSRARRSRLISSWSRYCIQYLRVNLGHRSPRVMSFWGTCVGWTVWLLGHIFGMPPLLLPGLEPASPGPPPVLTWVKPDMDREERSHPDSRISARVQSWELGLSRVMRPNRNHPELRHVSSLHYRLRHQSCLNISMIAGRSVSFFLQSVFLYSVTGLSLYPLSITHITDAS